MFALRSIAGPVRAPACAGSRHRCVVVRAEGINPSIRKSEEKVVDMVKVADLPTPKAVYCRCWRSAKFPYCDGAHVKHNKATGDNVGPLVIDSTPAAAPQ
ncbi:CDGSH iron-sulfur domain-containing protein 1 [Tetrabaena socialis]|uniref:CDGSH iron-sulfur domain-containing protein 1 n=1 Tax=Tetrabaena socialis TaxID=47790 RepID=A0A2J8A4F7_9CHLO|nr:CDGSH iron-sulfur domain-containing protein 1 [Tetrabaena socialis]|eukprot:PNH07411.1 CDGSH iron-sulfur domain-containing protein 1 [Tetrabaena socialis]